MKVDMLAFGAHPDDVELGCGATIAKEISLGKKVGIIDLTRGELGTRGTAKTRDEEAKNAARILGVSFRHNLSLADGFFKNNKENQLQIIQLIRKYQPKIVLCNAIDDRHIDHPKGSNLVSDACFLSGLRKIETTFEGKKQNFWRPNHVYHYIQWKNIEPDFVVDVTGFMNKKLNAVFAYKTQFHQEDTDEPATPISTTNFKDSIHYRAQDLGRLIGTEHAEGFTVERYVAVKSIFDIV
ncbi:MAG: bacillithiol biosynthesis deacetylase BshB1 [Flavobacteriales bacterium]